MAALVWGRQSSLKMCVVVAGDGHGEWGGNKPLELSLKLCRQVHDCCGSALPPHHTLPAASLGSPLCTPTLPQVSPGPPFHAPTQVPLPGEQRNSEKKGWKVWGGKRSKGSLVVPGGHRSPPGSMGLHRWRPGLLAHVSARSEDTHTSRPECSLLTLAGRRAESAFCVT